MFADSLNGQTVLFDPSIGPCQVLPFLVWVDQGAMAMNGYSVLFKAPGQVPHHQINIACQIQQDSRNLYMIYMPFIDCLGGGAFNLVMSS